MIKILTPPFSVLYTQLNPGLQKVKKAEEKILFSMFKLADD